MARLELCGIRKTYGNAARETLKGIDIDIRSGEFLILVGPSGCGKSTLMNAIAGLEEISEGARSRSMARTWWRWSPRTGTSPWCSSPTRCTRP